MNTDHLERLHRRRGIEERGDFDVLSSTGVGRIVAELLAADGYRQRDLSGEAIRLYRLDPSGSVPLFVPRAEFRAIVRTLTRSLLAEAMEEEPTRLIADTLMLITGGHRGADAWIRSVASIARDLQDDLTDDELDQIDDARRAATMAKRAAAAPAKREKDTRSLSERRAATRAAAEADTLALLRKWLPAEEDGYPLPDLWAKFQAARTTERVRELHPGTARIGRTAFYRLLERLGAVRTAHAGARLLRVPVELAIRHLLRFGRRAAALLLQRENHAERLSLPASPPPTGLPTWDELDKLMPPPEPPIPAASAANPERTHSTA